jgi:preprotein translocase subunit SecA
LDELLPPAIRHEREAGQAHLGQRHFDVQLIGGMLLTRASIAEMKTAKARRSSRRCPVY